jgi:glutaredoxin 3
MKKIILYSTTTCPWCIRLIEYLHHYNIDFELKKVDEDEKALKEMKEISGQNGVPVILIDGNIVVGFEKEEIDRLLKL